MVVVFLAGAMALKRWGLFALFFGSYPISIDKAALEGYSSGMAIFVGAGNTRHGVMWKRYLFCRNFAPIYISLFYAAC